MHFLELWTVFAKSGLFNGNRVRDKKDSTHPLFLHARQDQAAATVIAHILKMPLEHLGGLTSYWPPSPIAVIAYKGIQ
jgi:hypothetical protein